MTLRVFVQLFLITTLTFHSALRADQDVWLDFNAGWQANLATAALSAGVAPFTPDEVAMIEADLESMFEDAYQGYTVNFFTTAPAGFHERVDFGAITTNDNLLGLATFDFRNGSNSVQEVFVRNFDFFLEAGDSRDDQLRELTVSLAGTAIHEVGHAFGLRHVHAFGDPRITPANYADTQGFQNDHFMATGSTGLTESRRESPRTFSDWSRLHLEAASRLSDTGFTPFLELFVGDVGDDFFSASPLELQAATLVDADAATAVASLADDADVDLFQIALDEPAFVTADLWTGGVFDASLTLFDETGAELAFADDIIYSPTSFGMGTTFSDDPFMLNVPVEAGSYFLQIAANGPVPVGFGNYDLTLGILAVPEPSADCLLWLAGLIGISCCRRR